MQSPPLSAPPASGVFLAERCRIAVDDIVTIDALTAASRGERVLFVGDTTVLFGAMFGIPFSARRDEGTERLPGEARVVAGSLFVGGHDVARGAHTPFTGMAPLDPPLPPAWTALEYLAWSARLAGSTRRLAREQAIAALELLSLAALGARPLGSLALPERRALMLAHAVLGGPRTVIIEAPLSGLGGAGAGFVIEALGKATAGRGSIVSIGHLDPGSAEGALAPMATDLFVMTADHIVFAGPPAELFAGARVYALTVHSEAPALGMELRSRGIELRGGPLRFSVSLPVERSTSDIFAAAAAVRAPIVELVPIFARG